MIKDAEDVKFEALGGFDYYLVEVFKGAGRIEQEEDGSVVIDINEEIHYFKCAYELAEEWDNLGIDKDCSNVTVYRIPTDGLPIDEVLNLIKITKERFEMNKGND